MLGGALGGWLASRAAPGAAAEWRFGLPIGWPGLLPGDGFWIRHGYACENVTLYPGAWHTGENWFAFEQDTTGALIYAVADGDVVFVGSDYPGLVIIIEHAGNLFSMYGHLAYTAEVAVGDVVRAGDRIGTVLNKTDGRSPSHLHFEIRTFYTNPVVNGDSPQYGFACGFQCPPGPGYWPMQAPELPVALGWLNPLHVIGRRTFVGDALPADAEVQVPITTSGSLALRDRPGGAVVETIPVEPGQRFRLTGIRSGAERTTRTSADAYRLWFEIETASGARHWARAAIPSWLQTQTDGRPAAILLDLLPVSGGSL